MEFFSQVVLRDYPVEIIDGDRGANYPKIADFSDQGYCLFLSATNVTKSGFVFDNCSFVTSEKDGSLRKGKVKNLIPLLPHEGPLGILVTFPIGFSLRT